MYTFELRPSATAAAAGDTPLSGRRRTRRTGICCHALVDQTDRPGKCYSCRPGAHQRFDGSTVADSGRRVGGGRVRWEVHDERTNERTAAMTTTSRASIDRPVDADQPAARPLGQSEPLAQATPSCMLCHSSRSVAAADVVVAAAVLAD